MQAAELLDFFRMDIHPLGSAERLRALLQTVSCKEYLVAGSWAISLISGKSFNHTDIDIILLGEAPLYIDDSLDPEEHCNGRMPLPTRFLAQTALTVKNSIYGTNIKVPCLEFQIAVKLIGELDTLYSPRALQQLFVLFDCVQRLNLPNLTFILQSLLPASIDSDFVAKQILSSYNYYCSGDFSQAKAIAITSHRIMNAALDHEFRQL